jgi:hypothetical protein
MLSQIAAKLITRPEILFTCAPERLGTLLALRRNLFRRATGDIRQA